MKKLHFTLVIILFAILTLPAFAQEKPAKAETAKADSTLFQKYTADIQTLQAEGTQLENNIKSAQEELQRIIGRIQIVQQYAAEEKKKLDALKAPKKDEGKK